MPAEIEVPLAWTLDEMDPVGDAELAARVVQVLPFPRPEQVTCGSLAVQVEVLLDEETLVAAGAAAASSGR